MDKELIRKLKIAQRVVRELTGLALEIGTLSAVIKLIIESFS